MENKTLTPQEQAYWDFMTAAERCQWAWLAGIIDGEGSISIDIGHHKDMCKRGDYQLRVRVKMTDELTIRTAKAITHVGSVHPIRYPSELGWKTAWDWVTTDRKAASVLRHCMPFFVTKKEHARIALEFYKLTLDRRECNRGLREPNIEKRQALHEAICILNKKGPGKTPPSNSNVGD